MLRASEQSQSAATFARLADNVALACPTRSSLITNIMHGGHQTLTGGKQLVSAKPNTHVQAVLGAKVRACCCVCMRAAGWCAEKRGRVACDGLG